LKVKIRVLPGLPWTDDTLSLFYFCSRLLSENFRFDYNIFDFRHLSRNNLHFCSLIYSFKWLLFLLDSNPLGHPLGNLATSHIPKVSFKYRIPVQESTTLPDDPLRLSQFAIRGLFFHLYKTFSFGFPFFLRPNAVLIFPAFKTAQSLSVSFGRLSSFSRHICSLLFALMPPSRVFLY